MAKYKSKAKRQKISSASSEVHFRIARIELISSNLAIPQNVSSKTLGYYLEADINLFADISIIQVLITFKLFGDTECVLEMKVENDFKIANFSDIVKDGEIQSEDFTAFLVVISLGHSRGIQSTLTIGTPIAHYYLPPVSKDKLKSTVKINHNSKVPVH